MKNPYFSAGLLASASLALSACVTINIYFPAAAAEKAADRIIEDVWQLKKESKSEAGRPDADQSEGSFPAEPPVSTQPQSEQQSQ